jgi:ceramide glucosyltransferase
LHQRISCTSFTPAITVLKPLKGADANTPECLRSWLAQDYPGDVQFLFGVAAADDPACAVVQKLLAEFPQRDARLLICRESLGANAKVSTLVQLEREARHEYVIISDADVRLPGDFLRNCMAPLQSPGTGLVTCFYRLANPVTLAMRWEAVAINADFWSQVLQARSLKPLDFALGAVMAMRRDCLPPIGGFLALADFLADDYQLGRLLARHGKQIVICPVVVECWEAPQTWGQVWRHQLRWARTIRVCQPAPYFFSILSNATLWPLLLVLSNFKLPLLGVASFLLALRALMAQYLQYRLTQSRAHVWYDFMVPVKDLLQAVLWALAFAGNTVEWRGQFYRVDTGGKLTPLR